MIIGTNYLIAASVNNPTYRNIPSELTSPDTVRSYFEQRIDAANAFGGTRDLFRNPFGTDGHNEMSFAQLLMLKTSTKGSQELGKAWEEALKWWTNRRVGLKDGVAIYLGKIQGEVLWDMVGDSPTILRRLVEACVRPFRDIPNCRIVIDSASSQDESSPAWAVSEILNEMGLGGDYEPFAFRGTAWTGRPDKECWVQSPIWRRDRGDAVESWRAPLDEYCCPINIFSEEKIEAQPQEVAAWLKAGHNVYLPIDRSGRWKALSAKALALMAATTH